MLVRGCLCTCWYEEQHMVASRYCFGVLDREQVLGCSRRRPVLLGFA
jgi:hypothetical protein